MESQFETITLFFENYEFPNYGTSKIPNVSI
jgi:hypothetical protein